MTDRDLRLRLGIPRRPLRIWGYDSRTGDDITWLSSPRQGLPCDAKNVPFVRAQTVSGAAGGGM
ncbi:hypothetical protein, partial [Streptococcus pseudopneumoniae]|uniref:hypothetical protein n=1 Tax=Streptococcus pseudopneumoniae TaxID=257758 RepID=UPI0019D6A7DD